jgi:hypothetical protein
VRRIEGVLLHPQRDSRGIHHFRADEVDQLLAHVREGRVELVRQLRPTREAPLFTRPQPPCARCMKIEQDVAALREEVSALTRKLERVSEASDLTAPIEALLLELTMNAPRGSLGDGALGHVNPSPHPGAASVVRVRGLRTSRDGIRRARNTWAQDPASECRRACAHLGFAFTAGTSDPRRRQPGNVRTPLPSGSVGEGVA